jgi:putative heme degradation protein
VRRLYLSEPSQSPRRVSSTTEVAVENGRLNAENAALRINCEMWRKRAEAHGAATLGLLRAARVAKEQAFRMVQERDELQRQCDLLKRQLEGDKYDHLPATYFAGKTNR